MERLTGQGSSGINSGCFWSSSADYNNAGKIRKHGLYLLIIIQLFKLSVLKLVYYTNDFF